MHIVAHAVSKITLFFAAGAIYTASHKTEVSQLDGIGRRMPWTMLAFTIGALSLIGIPPAAGFVSKWYIFSGAAAAGKYAAARGAGGEHAAQRGLFPAHRVCGVLPRAAAGEAAHGEAPCPMVAAMRRRRRCVLLFAAFAGVPLALARALAAGDMREMR